MPEARPSVLSRPRLDDPIAEAMRRPIAFVRGAWGTGKSTAVADFLDRRERPYARYVLPDDGVSVFDFVLGLADVLAPFTHGAHPLSAIAGELAGGDRNPGLALVAWLREHLTEAGLVLVVDNVIEARQVAPIATLLATLAEETRPALHWWFLGRDFSALPLASWMAHGYAGLPLDADELRFDAQEAIRLGRLRETPLGDATIERLAERVRGRPLLVSWALDVLRDDAAAAHLPDGDRAAFDALLAVTLDSLRPGERAALFAASVLPDLDPRVVAALPPGTIDATLERIADAVPALFVRGASPRFQPEVRRALAERAAADPAAYHASLRDAAAALERCDRSEAALQLFADIPDAEGLADVLRREGLELAERGAWTRIDPALRRLEGTPFADDPLLIALRAASESRRDHFDTAEAWFRLAIERSAGAPDAIRIAHGFALEAMRRGRPDIVESVAARILAQSDPDEPVTSAMRATLATALAASAQRERAQTEIELVLERLPQLPPKDRARVLQQAAFVAVRGGAFERARTLAGDAFAEAVAAGAYNVAALAKTLLYEVAIEADDDSTAALAHLEEFARYALLSGGERLHLFSLVATFSVHVERGDLSGIEKVEKLLQGRELVQHTAFINETLLADEAMRAAWSGDFEHALRLVAGTVDQEAGARKIRRQSEVAVYAAAAGRELVSREAIEQAAPWRDLPLGRRNGRSPALLALAHVLLGELANARSVIKEASDRGALEGVHNAALFAAIDAAIGYAEGRRTPAAVQTSLSRLQEHGLGGYARLIAALPARRIGTAGA